MRIYLANHSSLELGYLQGKYGQIGWLLSPQSYGVTKQRDFMPMAFDNDAYSAYQNQTEWNESAWYSMLDKMEKEIPADRVEWVLVPDVVGDMRATLANFFLYREAISRRGWPVAMAVQDGMVPQDVPCTVDVIFVGGTTSWKWKSLPMWVGAFSRVHVGRVNSLQKLEISRRLGVESVDGTYWFRFRKPEEYLKDLESFFKNEPKPQLELFDEGKLKTEGVNHERASVTT